MAEQSTKGSMKNYFLSEFLRLHVRSGNKVDGLDEESLTFAQRSLVLDNTIVKRSKKVKAEKKRKRKLLSASERKKLKLFAVQPEVQRYDLYLPMHDLWTNYMKEVTNIESVTEKGWDELMRRVSKCDLHGAVVKVVKCKCPSMIGLEGIVLIETKNAFNIISQDNRIRNNIKNNNTAQEG